MNYKVCVYTICKNEINGIEKWYNSLSEADMIVLCDTGSNDGTWEYIKDKTNKDSRFKVMQYIHNEEIFHFAKARNVSLDFVHEYCFDSDNTKWILIMLDIDEIFDEGAISRIKEQWIDGKKSMNIIGLNPWNKGYLNGTPQKVHSNDIQWRWYGRVHETLCYDETPFYNLPSDDFIYSENVSYVHYQVFDGVKHEYLDHMWKMFEENPNDAWNLRNLFGECIDKGLWQKVIEVGPVLIDVTLRGKDSDFVKHEFPIHAYLGMSVAYNNLKDTKNEFECLLKACELNEEYDRYFRRPYTMMGDYFKSQGDTDNMLEFYSRALKNQNKNKNVVDNPYYDSDHKIYSSLSLYYYYNLNDKFKSLAYSELAYYVCDDDEEIKNNYKNDIDIILSNILNEKVVS